MPPATTTAKKPTTSRRAATPKAAAPAEPATTEPQPPPELDPDGGQGDLLVIPTGADAEPAPDAGERIEVFKYRTKVFSMPTEVSFQQALHLVWVVKEYGALTGGLQVVRDLLGAEALNILLTAPEIEDAHITHVIGIVSDHVTGRVEVGRPGKG